MEILQKYTVGDRIFDSYEDAELFVSENEDQMRIDAFTEYLRENGRQRITSVVTETLAEFIKFEKGLLTGTVAAPAELVEHVEPGPEITAEKAVSDQVLTTEPEQVKDAVEPAEAKSPAPSLFAESDAASEEAAPPPPAASQGSASNALFG